jgi:spore germination protein YaaH
MSRALLLLILLSLIIPVPATSAHAIIRAGNVHVGIVLQQKKPVDTTKTAKAVAGAVKTGGGVINGLVKPFRARVQNIMKGLLDKDSTNTAVELAKLRLELKAKLQTDSAVLTAKATEIRKQLLTKIKNDSAILQKLTAALQAADQPPGTGNAKATGDQVPFEIGTQFLTPEEAKAKAQTLYQVNKLYDGPLPLIETPKGSKVRYEINVSHKTKVLGFYSDKSINDISDFNFRLLTTLVYAIDPMDGDPFVRVTRNSALFENARRAGCKIILSVVFNKSAYNNQIFKSNSAGKNFIARSLALADSVGATGINIDLTGVDKSLNEYFAPFISLLHQACQGKNKGFETSITIPAAGNYGYALVRVFKKSISYFIIDFTTAKTPGPLAPLNNASPNSVEARFSAYLALGVPASKLILGVPYHGVGWSNNVPQYISYNDIQRKYQDAVPVYKKGASAAQIDVSANGSYLDIWYDNDRTLGEKYDYALNNKLRGVAIKYIDEDGILPELKQELEYKLSKIDTVLDSIKLVKPSPKPPIDASFAHFWVLLTENPCTHKGEFEPYRFGLELITWSVLGVLIIGFVAFRYIIKTEGDNWKWKGQSSWALIILFVVWLVIFLMYLFFAKWNRLFGPSNGVGDNCVNIKFITLFFVQLAGIGAGLVIWLVYKLNHDDERV